MSSRLRLPLERLKRGTKLRYTRPTDYFESAIYKGGKAVSQFDGSYMGYINFDEIRYWDGRYLKAFKVSFIHI